MSEFQNIILRYFYLGNSKYAPGTIASFFVLLFFFFIPNTFIYQSCILFSHILIGFYFCYLFSIKKNKDKDPSFIVIDEVAGMMISLYLVPKYFSAYLLAFILFRFFDIFKPYPISLVDKKMKSGFGIVLDDILAGLFTLIVILLFFWGVNF